MAKTAEGAVRKFMTLWNVPAGNGRLTTKYAWQREEAERLGTVTPTGGDVESQVSAQEEV